MTKMRSLRLLPLIIVLVAHATAAEAQSISGRVVDDATLAGLSAVEVSVVAMAGGDTLRVVTDTAGRFLLRLPTGGRYLLTATRLGYRPLESLVVDVATTQRTEVVLRMAVRAVPIDALTVTARRVDDRHRATWDGFLARHANRREIGSTLIMNRNDPIFRHAVNVRRVLQWLPPRAFSASARRVGRADRCVVVLMDGDNAPGWSVDRVMQLSSTELEGIEFYSNPLDAPLEFRSGGPCSILAVWRRSPNHRVPGGR
jgi:hypothetical protein